MASKKIFTIALSIGALFLGYLFGFYYFDDKVLYQGHFHGILVNPLGNELLYEKTGQIIVGEHFISGSHNYISESGQIYMKHRVNFNLFGFGKYDKIEREIRTEGVVSTHRSLDIFNHLLPIDVRLSSIKFSKLPQLPSFGSNLYYLERTHGVLTINTLNHEPST